MGFLAPWFLSGLAALGVPVFVHLLRRHVTTPRPMSSLMFIERGVQSSTRHRRLRYLLLFALRVALLLLLVLAFANPFVRRTAADANARVRLIVLDNSFSMRAGTRFADARREALAVLAAKPPEQKAQIMALGGQLEILTQPISDASELHAALESIQPSDGRASFGELGRAVRSLAGKVSGPIDLHLFSDMQRSAMPANFADAVLPANATLLLHPVATGPAQPNWTVESIEAPVQVSEPSNAKEAPRSRVRAVIAGFGTPAATRTVSLVINGKTVASRKIDLPANGRATLEFPLLDIAYGFNRCAIQIDSGDAFPADDISLFAVRRSDPERVLFVHSAGDTRSAVYFGSALAAAAEGAFLLQSASADQTTDLDPSRFAFVVLSDAVSLPPIFARTLSQYVAKGGRVLIALGTNATSHTPIPVWGADVQDTRNYARLGAPANVGQVDFTYPALLQPQPGRDNGGWAAVKVFYAAIVNSSQARVAARLTDGTPLLLEKEAGEGRVLLLATGLENLTNDLPLHPVFVAFIDHLSQYLSGREQLLGSRPVDFLVPLLSSSTAASSAQPVEVIDPDGKRPLSLAEARTARTFRLTRSGFYQIRFANGQESLIGVNPDRRESDLEPLPKEVQQLWSGSSSGAQSSAEPSSTNASQDEKNPPVSLWWYVMLLTLAAVIAESVIASGYMGTQREEA
jgi:hypothetical protein